MSKSALRTRLLQDFDAEMADRLISSLTDEQAAEALAGMDAADQERADLKARLMADTNLRLATTPHTSWGTPEARFQIAQTATKMIENTATKHGIEMNDLIEALLAEGNTMQAGIEFLIAQGQGQNGDPRFDGFAPGQSFYFFRCRLSEALAAATQERNAAESDRREAERDARWAAQGMERCDRCWGAGGFSHWPGFTCYECGGLGAKDS